jgi:membrane-bound lytic murein transglycosylase MltF
MRIAVHPLAASTLIACLAWSTAFAQIDSRKSQATGSATAEAAKVRQLHIANKPWTGDFDRMLQRRMIRVYAPYSRSLYFVDKGRERGLGAELVRDFERWVNKKHAKQLGKRPLTLFIVAATRDKLLPDLRDGLADIAIAT